MTEPVQSPATSEDVIRWTVAEQTQALIDAPVVVCPCCDHGMDPHGVDPGGMCGVGGCSCLLTPGAIYEALRPDVAVVQGLLDSGDPVILYVSHEGLRRLLVAFQTPNAVLEGDMGPRVGFRLYPKNQES